MYVLYSHQLTQSSTVTLTGRCYYYPHLTEGHTQPWHLSHCHSAKWQLGNLTPGVLGPEFMLCVTISSGLPGFYTGLLIRHLPSVFVPTNQSVPSPSCHKSPFPKAQFLSITFLESLIGFLFMLEGTRLLGLGTTEHHKACPPPAVTSELGHWWLSRPADKCSLSCTMTSFLKNYFLASKILANEEIAAQISKKGHSVGRLAWPI